ncbi:MAG: D-lysine 5,6-aminomutase subunit alpha [Deltaproteobacteria bacterium]|nr:D-lysine 5,6-aminomutase subunit alpha [Deltaproteobacteria bacterium]
MPHIQLDQEQIKRVKKYAKKVADEINTMIEQYSTVSVERTVLRLYGVDGIDKNDTPLPNRLVEMLQEMDLLDSGASHHFAAATLESGRNPQVTAELLEQGHIKFSGRYSHTRADIVDMEQELVKKGVKKLDSSRQRKRNKQQITPVAEQPWKYMIVATGNIFEDRTQARAAAGSGADIIAVIRSTAQSLLDYVPCGATTEGFGGTFATQENFRIMRRALDESSEENGRYIRLVNYASGLCMAEIAACAALEDLDMLLNDSMYGILFRDINMKRTFVDQHFSRLICARAGIIINTGEDNYLTTSDAIDNAYTVTASQLINEAMGKNSNLTDDLLGLGHAFEINPEIKNGFLYELAHAQLARQLFPRAPLKYMPPTKYKSTDIFYSHSMDTMFNLASVATGQGIHLAGILTEAIHTPLMQDRYQSLSAINYVFNSARELGDEIEFKDDGLIATRARQVLNETETFLKEIQKDGLVKAISQGKFADIQRYETGGKGLDGVFSKGPLYSNPLLDQLEEEGVIND